MKKTIQNVIIVSLLLNVLLMLSKLLFGYLGSSSSLISDGYNSLSDVFVSIVLVIFLKISHKEPDDNHPYGHEKYEALVYFILGLILILTAFFIGYGGILGLIRYIDDKTSFVKPSTYTMIIAGIAIIIKMFLFIINHRISKKFKVASLKADALNHLFDIFATSASLASIGLAQMGLLYFEYIASIIIALIIIQSSVPILREATAFLVDESPDPVVVETIKATAMNVGGVVRVDDIKVRMHMNQLYVDMEIAVDSNLNLKKAHAIAEHVHDTIEQAFDVIHCMVHVNPVD